MMYRRSDLPVSLSSSYLVTKTQGLTMISMGQIAASIERNLPLIILDPEPFVELPRPPRLGRFSRYWREAERVVWEGF